MHLAKIQKKGENKKRNYRIALAMRLEYYSAVTDLELLTRLLSGQQRSAEAWREFLEAYSNLILKIAWQFERDRDKVMELYVRICSRLAEGDFGVLRTFRRGHSERAPKFTTWLAAVVRNLCIDAHRSARGRKRMPGALLRAPAVERTVFELYYWRGFSLEEIERHLATQRNGSADSVAEILERIEARLLRIPATPAMAQVVHLSYDDRYPAPEADDAPAIDPETLDQWLSKLPADHRLVVQLAFWEDLTPEELGIALRMTARQATTLLREALNNLRTIAGSDQAG